MRFWLTQRIVKKDHFYRCFERLFRGVNGKGAEAFNQGVKVW